MRKGFLSREKDLVGLPAVCGGQPKLATEFNLPQEISSSFRENLSEFERSPSSRSNTLCGSAKRQKLENERKSIPTERSLRIQLPFEDGDKNRKTDRHTINRNHCSIKPNPSIDPAIIRKIREYENLSPFHENPSNSSIAPSTSAARTKPPSQGLRQTSLDKFLPPQKFLNGDLKNYASSLSSGLVKRSSIKSNNIRKTRSSSPAPWKDNFVLSIKLSPDEERLFLRFKYMYQAAVKNLKDTPPFPTGLEDFQSGMLQVQIDATKSQIELKNLTQALCAGQFAAKILTGSEITLNAVRCPEWAKVPSDLPNTFLKELKELLRDRNVIIILPGMNLNDLYRLSQKLRSFGLEASYTTELKSWLEAGGDEVLLLSSDNRPDGLPSYHVNGVILHQNSKKWPGFNCGTIKIESEPEFVDLIPKRTAFVDTRLKELLVRLNATESMVVDTKPLNVYGVDVCTYDFGIVFNCLKLSKKPNRKVYTQIFCRILRACHFFRRVAIVSLGTRTSADHLRKLIDFVNVEKSGGNCEIQMVDASRKSLVQVVSDLCIQKGDDLADFAFFSVRNTALAKLIAEENPNQTPYGNLLSTLL